MMDTPIEQAFASASAAELFASVRVAHEHALRRMRESKDQLARAIRRAEMARAHAERCGELLILAVQLKEQSR